MMLTLVIPAYNEEKRIVDTLRQVVRYCNDWGEAYEIVVVDDGSVDQTAQVAAAAADDCAHFRMLQNPHNMGKGYAIRRGILQSKGDIILFSDADLSTPIAELPKFSQALAEGCDIAIGTRAHRLSDIQRHQVWYREQMGKTFNRFVQALVIKGFKDTQCGFKCFKREAAWHIFSKQRLNRFSFDVELLYLAQKYGYSVKEIPVQWVNSAESQVAIVRDSLNMLLDLMKIHLFDWLRCYE